MQSNEDNHSTLISLLQSRAKDNPDFLCYTFLSGELQEKANITYKSLDKKARTIAAALQAENAQGHTVLLLFEPGEDYVYALFGCFYARAIAVPAYPPLTTEMAKQLIHIMDNADIRVILTTQTIYSRLRSLKFLSPIAKLIGKVTKKFSHSVSLLQAVSRLQKATILCVDKIPDKTEKEFKITTVNEDDIAYLQYTSGSTRMPKGVVITHRNLLSNIRQIQAVSKGRQHETLVNWLPPYHDMGLISGILLPIYAGYKVVHMSPFDFLQNPFRWLETVTRYKANGIGGPDFAYQLCIKKISGQQKKQLDLSHVRFAFVGAEKIRPDTLIRFYQAFRECGLKEDIFFPCYGLAEAILLVTGQQKNINSLFKTFSRRELLGGKAVPVSDSEQNAVAIVGVGRPAEGVSIEIVNPNTLENLAVDNVGEIWVKGPNVVSKYWNDPAASHEIMEAKLTRHPHDKFLRTGDLGFIHDGELYITGRMKEVIIIAGANHYPNDIEIDIEQDVEGVRRGCVAAFSVEQHNQECLIIVSEVNNDQKDKLDHKICQSIVNKIKSSVASHHGISVEEVVLIRKRSIPKTTSGKLRRLSCKQSYADNHLNIIYKG